MRISILLDPGNAGSIDTLADVMNAWGGRSEHTVEIVMDGTQSAFHDALESADAVVVDQISRFRGQISSLTAGQHQKLIGVDLAYRSSATDDVRVLYGRGLDTFRWAAQSLVANLLSPATRHPYGSERDQFADLRLPSGSGPHPVAVLLHGGFWRRHWGLDLMDDIAARMRQRGYATWNQEYRRGPGSVDAALADVLAGLNYLKRIGEDVVDTTRVGLIGHSAGGQLAMWASHGPPRQEQVSPAVCVALSPVSDLVACAERGLGDGAAVEFLGGTPEEVGDAYEVADPRAGNNRRLCPITVVQGLADSVDLIDLNRQFCRLGQTQQEPGLTLVEVSDADHFDVINPLHAAWRHVESAFADADCAPKP